MYEFDLEKLIKLAEKKPAGTATKRDPAKWEAAKRKAKAKMGGKHSARAMQLATKYYKQDGGKYKGKKPSASNNKLKKWTKQDWQWSGERDKKSSVIDSIVEKLAGKGVYLPAKSIAALKSSKKGRNKLKAASRKKSKATREGKQVARHGLHKGKKRSKLGEEKRYRPKVQALLYDDLGSILASKSQAEGSGLRAYPNYKFPGGGVEPGESLVEAARKELLEEAGYSPASDPEDFGYKPTKVDWDEAFRQQALAKGRDFHGEEQFYMTAPVGEKVDSLLGSEGDQMTGLEFVPMSKLREALEASSKDPSNEYSYFDVEKLKVLDQLKKHLDAKGVKTAASDPNYRDRVALWLHDGKGNLLVQDDRDRGLGLKFPGGGIDEGQSVNDAAMREALEEVGYSLADKPRAIPGVRAKKIDWDPIFSAEAAAKGRNYKGSKHYHRLALAGEPDESLLGSEGDALAANWMPIAEVLEATRSAAANPDNKYNYFDEERLRAAEKVYNMLTQKTASDLQEVKDKLRVAILSGSTGDDPEELSRSRALAEAYRDYLTSHGAEVDWMDMRDMGDMPDTYDWDTDWYDDYKKRLTDADAMVLSTPIFNYGPSGKVLQFLHRTLDKENQEFKPYTLLSGAGSPRSALALGGLANQLDTEIKGIGIGGGVQVAGDEFNVETGEMDPGIISRANENAAKLLQVAGALRNKTSSYQSPLMRAYLVGVKLATADFGDNGSSDDMTLSFDNDVQQKVDPKDFVSSENHGNMTPSTNQRGWIGVTDEVNPDKTEATNYKRDYLERT